LLPVLLDAKEDFKPEPGPAFWPANRYAQWLTGKKVEPRSTDFLGAPLADLRDHVSLDAEAGAAAEGQLFTTAGITSVALPRHGQSPGTAKPIGPRRFDSFAEIELAARVEGVPLWGQEALAKLFTWHPLGGERR